MLGARRAEVPLWLIKSDGGVLHGLDGRVPLQQALWPQEELREAQVQRVVLPNVEAVCSA
jgi:hypothetical protein